MVPSGCGVAVANGYLKITLIKLWLKKMEETECAQIVFCNIIIS